MNRPLRRTAVLLTILLSLGASRAALAAPTPAEAQPPGAIARLLAGREGGAIGDAAFQQALYQDYRGTVGERWGAWHERIGTPMAAWAAKTLEQAPGETVFYPFSGPDFPTVHRLYPNAGRYVLVAWETAGRAPQLGSLAPADLRRVFASFKEGLRCFMHRGFFVSKQMHAQFLRKDALLEGLTGALLAFAELEGFDVVALTPIRIAADGGDVEPHPGPPAERATWDSVRLDLRRRADGAAVVLDYVSLNLLDRHLATSEASRRWLAARSRERVVLKAASHLLQSKRFTYLRDQLAAGARTIVQDETGLPYRLLEEHFEVRLFGRFRRFLERFAPGPAKALREAYASRDDVEPLPFRFGYVRKEPSCIQYGVRRAAAASAQESPSSP